MTISCEQIRAYAAAHPNERHVDVARALGVTPARCYNAMRQRGGRPPSVDYPERRKKLLPMLPGGRRPARRLPILRCVPDPRGDRRG